MTFLRKEKYLVIVLYTRERNNWGLKSCWRGKAERSFPHSLCTYYLQIETGSAHLSGSPSSRLNKLTVRILHLLYIHRAQGLIPSTTQKQSSFLPDTWKPFSLAYPFWFFPSPAQPCLCCLPECGQSLWAHPVLGLGVGLQGPGAVWPWHCWCSPAVLPSSVFCKMEIDRKAHLEPVVYCSVGPVCLWIRPFRKSPQTGKRKWLFWIV